MLGTVCAKTSTLKGQKAERNKNQASVVKKGPMEINFADTLKYYFLWLVENIEYLFLLKDTIFSLNHLFRSLYLSIFRFFSGSERK